MAEIIFLLSLSLAPAIAMFAYVYKSDQDKEPPGLIAKLLLFGALSAVPAMALEMAGGAVLDTLKLDPSSLLYVAIESFIVIAVAEEGVKYLFLCSTRNDKNFTHVYDGVVYAVAVGLGFAALENVLYVFANGVGTGIARAVLAVPLHCSCAIIMGMFYGFAKKSKVLGDKSRMMVFALLAFIVPVFVHGLYDMAAISQNPFLLVTVLSASLALFVVTLIMVRRMSKWDISFAMLTQRAAMPAFGPQGVPYAPQQPYGYPFQPNGAVPGQFEFQSAYPTQSPQVPVQQVLPPSALQPPSSGQNAYFAFSEKRDATPQASQTPLTSPPQPHFAGASRTGIPYPSMRQVESPYAGDYGVPGAQAYPPHSVQQWMPEPSSEFNMHQYAASMAQHPQIPGTQPVEDPTVPPGQRALREMSRLHREQARSGENDVPPTPENGETPR